MISCFSPGNGASFCPYVDSDARRNGLRPTERKKCEEKQRSCNVTEPEIEEEIEHAIYALDRHATSSLLPQNSRWVLQSSHRLPNALFWKIAAPNNCTKPLISLVPGERFELPTNGLQNRCSTTELTRHCTDLAESLDAVLVRKPRHTSRGNVSANGKYIIKGGDVRSAERQGRVIAFRVADHFGDARSSSLRIMTGTLPLAGGQVPVAGERCTAT